MHRGAGDGDAAGEAVDEGSDAIYIYIAVPPWMAAGITAFESVSLINTVYKYGEVATQVRARENWMVVIRLRVIF